MGLVAGKAVLDFRSAQRAAFSAMRRISSAPQSRPWCARRAGIARCARQEGRRYRLRRQLAATVARHMTVQTRRTKLRQPEFRPFHFFDTRLLLATIYLN